MLRRLVIGVAMMLATAALVAQAPASYLLPLWSGGHWIYLTLGSTFKVSGGVVDVIPPAFTPAPNDIYVLTAPMAGLTLKCPAGDIYRNGTLQAEAVGGDYAVDSTGLVVTFSNTFPATLPQPGDTIKVTYRCSK